VQLLDVPHDPSSHHLPLTINEMQIPDNIHKPGEHIDLSTAMMDFRLGLDILGLGARNEHHVLRY
jgi:hypothetical protein